MNPRYARLLWIGFPECHYIIRAFWTCRQLNLPQNRLHTQPKAGTFDEFSPTDSHNAGVSTQGFRRGPRLVLVLASAWQLRRSIARLLLCRQFHHNCLLAVSVLHSLEPVVKCCKRDVGLQEIGGG